MKRVLFICTMLAACSTLFAQKYAVIDARNTLTEACRDSRNIDYKLVNKAWRDIQECMVNEKSKDYYDTWVTAAKIKNILTYKVYQDGQAGTLDTLKYFSALSDILSYYQKVEKCITTPNEKGKMPVKADEYKEIHQDALQQAVSMRGQILTGACSVVNSHPDGAMKLFDHYFETFDDPLFKDLNLNETDTLKESAYLYYGMAMKNKAVTWEDTVRYLNWYEKVLDSPTYGTYTCVELMDTYKRHGDMEKWEKYCRYAAEHYNDVQFPKLLVQEKVRQDKLDEAMKLCDEMGKLYPEEIYFVETKALMVFNDKKYREAIDIFKKLIEIDPTYARAWTSLGTCYYQIAMENKNNIPECKKWINEAIPCYKKAEECEPDNPILWGNYLYRCYHALSDSANEKKYAKYKDS
ncbi:MAG: hypothetical protein IJT28_00510 [Bacteroidaceae bacterium]|nr:hypothetical protein [Bacteroidaceae bacterium]